MTPEPDDDVRESLRRHAESITPRGTYAELEAKLAAARPARRVTGRHVVLGLAAAIALLVGALTVAIATGGDDQEVTTAGPGSTSSTSTTTSTLPPTTPPPTDVPATTSTTEVPAATTSTTTSTTEPPTTTTTTTPTPAALDDTAVVRLGAIGALQLPSGITSAEQVTGRQVDGELDSGQGACSYATFVDGPTDVQLMVENSDPPATGTAHDLGDAGRIVRVDVSRSATVRAVGVGGPDASVGIGSTEAEVTAAFPDLEVQPAKYVEGGHFLVVTDPEDPSVMLLFETDGQVVTTFRTGVPEYVELVEGCF